MITNTRPTDPTDPRPRSDDEQNIQSNAITTALPSGLIMLDPARGILENYEEDTRPNTSICSEAESNNNLPRKSKRKLTRKETQKTHKKNRTNNKGCRCDTTKSDGTCEKHTPIPLL